MRVIAGRLGGRLFEAPNGHRTHPMSEKIRGAIFNALGDITGLTLLDAFTGSGALCFEAASRGAEAAIGIDIDKMAITTAVKSAENLGLKESVRFIRANASSWSDNNETALFDVVILDPPYDDVRPDLLKKLAKHCKANGVLVVSLPPNAPVSQLTGFEEINSKDYNDATLQFFRRLQ